MKLKERLKEIRKKFTNDPIIIKNGGHVYFKTGKLLSKNFITSGKKIMMEKKDILEEGYYWVLLHPIFEEGWTVGYYDGIDWYLHGLEGPQESFCVDEVGNKIPEPPEKINYS